MQVSRLWVVGIGAVVLSVCASAGDVTLTPTKDTYVQSVNPNTNYGQSDQLWLGRGQYWGLGTIRGLVQFDLSSLPGDPDLIVSATLSAYQYDTQPAAGGLPVDLVRLTGAWGEPTVTWNNQPGFDGTVWASADVGDSFYDGWINWDATGLVKAYAGGQYTNVGWLLKASYEGEAGASRLGYFHSKEYVADPLLWPKLVVNVVPEPAALWLLALTGLALRRR